MSLPLSSKLLCPHDRTTEPDEDGYGVCLRCGGTVILRLTRHIVDKAAETIKRGE